MPEGDRFLTSPMFRPIRNSIGSPSAQTDWSRNSVWIWIAKRSACPALSNRARIPSPVMLATRPP
jgi:hypothetical protein